MIANNLVTTKDGGERELFVQQIGHMTHFASSTKKLWKHTLTNSIEDYGVTGSMFIKEWQWKSFNSRIWLMFDSQHQQEEHKSKVWLEACLTTLKMLHFFKAFYEFYSPLAEVPGVARDQM
jgi:hypothetical protein